MNFKNGFTLSEVLITLVIIGVIAALTIPALMNKTNEQDTVVAVKKAYSILGQAYQRVVVENGKIIPSSLGSNNTESTEKLGKMFAKQLNTQKVCGMSTEEDCFATGRYKVFNGNLSGDFSKDSGLFKMILSDGMSFGFSGINYYSNTGGFGYFGSVYVDINGAKAPNVWGKDMFAFYITKNGISPRGTPNDSSFPLSMCRNYGTSCTAWVIAKGNVDYWYKDVSW